MDEIRKRYPSPHDKHYVKAWKNCRRGYALCIQDPEAMEKVVQRIKRFTSEGPNIYSMWLEILEGKYPDHAVYLTDGRYENYFDMPIEEQDFFYIAQSHPFSVLFAWENYEMLKRRRVKEHEY